MGVNDTADQPAANGSGDQVERSRQRRERSQIAFPYTDIGEALELVKVLHERGGGAGQREQLAAWMDQSADGGTFRSRVSAAAMFGFIRADRTSVTITPLGRDAVDAQKRDAARAEAFLNAPLFRAMYEKNQGYPLPPPAAVERQVVDLGVSAKQKERARQTFTKSANLAGYIDPGSGRLVKPAIKQRVIEELDQEDEHIERERDGNGSGGGDQFHPLIKGLLEALPDTGTRWPRKERAKWLRLAAYSFEFIYKLEDEDDGDIEIRETRKDTTPPTGAPS